MFDVRINSEAFRKDLERAQASLSSLMLQSLQRTAETAAAYARTTTLFRFRTGALRSSIKANLTGGFTARTSANAKHAGFMEHGTRAHVILPRRKQYLRFVQNGAVRFSKGVFHPGTKPRPFMKAARDRVEPLFDRLVREAFARSFA